MKTLNRLKLLRIVICLGFIVGIVFSHELWFPIARTFPRAPIFINLPGNLVLPVERLLGVVLVISLILITIAVRTKIFSITAIASLLLLILFDQMRLQPWVYQYLLLILFTLHDWQPDDEAEPNRTLCLSQIVIAGLYFWSGVQKLNLSFSSETLPFLLEPLQCLFPEMQPPFLLIGLSVALIESLIGVGLLFRKTRNAAASLAIIMHASILGLLVAKGFNSIVWVWNTALILMVAIAFWKSDVQFTREIAISSTNDLKRKTARLITAASLLLPILSFFGWWDLYLSGALYSGNTSVGVIRIDEGILRKLPPQAQQTVFHTKTGGERILPLFEWATTDLNVPVYPEPRVFKQIFSETCKLSNGENNIELIIKERTAIFDGSYQVKRINCAQIER